MRSAIMWSTIGVVMLLGWTGLAAAQAAPAAPPPANPTLPPAAPSAAAATVHLKNGGLIRGELIELQPGTAARMKLADGTVRAIPWAEIDHVDDPSLPPPPPAEGASAARATAAPSASPALAAPAAAANASEIERLRAERDDIDNTGPALMMILGGGAAVFIGLPGVIVLGASSLCDDASSSYNDRDCKDARTTGAVMTVVGVVGAGVAIWGLIRVQHNRHDRERLDRHIRELKGESTLSFDLQPRKEGLALGLTLHM